MNIKDLVTKQTLLKTIIKTTPVLTCLQAISVTITERKIIQTKMAFLTRAILRKKTWKKSMKLEMSWVDKVWEIIVFRTNQN